MEIAKLEAIITGDVKPLLSSLDQAEAGLTEFAHTGDRTFLNLNASLSKTAQVALAAGTDIKSLTLALDVLQREQSGIIRGTALWQLYETEIKKVNAQLDILEAQLPIVTAETKSVGAISTTSFASVGKSLTSMLGGLRSIAYILPGIGIAGIFNLAFEAISKAATGLGLFGDKLQDVSEDAKALQQSLDGLEDSIAKDILKVKELAFIASDTNNPYNVRLQAVKKLREEYGPYLNNLSDEKILNGEIADAITEINQALLAKLALQAGEEKILALLKQRLDVQFKLNQLQEKQLTTAGFAASLKDASGNAKALGVQLQAAFEKSLPGVEQMQSQIGNLDKQIQGLFNLLKSSISKSVLLDFDPDGNVPKTTKAVKDLGEAFKTIRDNQISIIDNNQKIVETFVGNAAGIKPTNFKVNTEGLDEFLKRLDTAKTLAEELSGVFIDMFETLATTGRLTFRDLSHEVIRFVASLAKAAIEAAILRAILSFINPATALTGSQITSIVNAFGKIPMLAGGGVVNSPTLAVVGESGPEAVIPLNQLSNLAVNNSQNIIVTGRISGSDIVLVQNRQNQRNNRNYGLNFN